MVKIKSIATFLSGLFFVLLMTSHAPVSDQNPAQNNKLSRSDKARYIKNAESVFKFTNINDKKLVYALNYEGMDTVLRCIHRMEVLTPEGVLENHAFTVLNSKELFLSPGQKFETIGWLSGLPSLVVDLDTLDIMLLDAYDTMPPEAFLQNPNMIPVVAQDYGIEYVNTKYFDRSKEVLSLSTFGDYTHIRYAEDSRKLLLNFIVMIDLKREMLLNSATCKWEKIQILDSANSVKSSSP